MSEEVGTWTPIYQRHNNNRDPELIELSSDTESETERVPSKTRNLSKDSEDSSETDDDIIVVLDCKDDQEERASAGPSLPSTETENPVQKMPTRAGKEFAVNGAVASTEVNSSPVQSDSGGPEVTPQERSESINDFIHSIIGSPQSYVPFFDPNVDLNETTSDINNGDDPEESQSTCPSGESIQEERETNCSPKPSTSKNNRPGPSNKRKVMLSESSDSEDVVPRGKRTRRKLSLRSSGSGTDSDDDEDDVVYLKTKSGRHSHKKKKSVKRPRRKLSLRRSSGSGTDSDDNDDNAPLKTRLEKRSYEKKKSVKRPLRKRKPSLGRSSGFGSDSEDDDDNAPLKTRIKKRSYEKKKPVKRPSKRGSKKKTKRSVTSDNGKKRAKICQKTLRSATGKKKKVSQRDMALEKLRDQMEARKAKELTRAKSLPREKSKKDKEESSESDASSESVYSMTSSFVVPDDEEVMSFDGSTPSSSSVTSSGETDEEPDLDSGSEGEKDLKEEDSEDDKKADEKSDRTSSSSDEGAPDDGQEDTRCLLCKELGSNTFEGRLASRNTSWCRCGECKMFAPNVGDYDLVCCKEMSTIVNFLEDELDDDVCITEHSRFKVDVLQGGGYARGISKRPTFGLRTGGGAAAYYEYNYSNNARNERLYNATLDEFKKSGRKDKCWKSLRSFKYWIFDRINAPGDQKIPIPACVLAKVRDVFKMSNYYYRPFKTRFQCPNGRHCMLTFDNTPNNYYY